MTHATDQIQAAAAALQRGDLEGAEDALTLAFASSDTAPAAARLLAQVWLARGDKVKARDWIGKAVALAPATGVFWNDCGVIERLSGDDRAAVAAFERAVACDPGDANALHNLGMTRRALRDFAGARDALAKAVELAPSAALTLTALGITESDLGNIPDAVRAFERVANLTPGDASGWVNLGAARARAGDAAGAEAALRTAIARAPDLALAYQHLAELLIGQGDWAGGIACYEDAVAHDPNANFALAGLAMARLTLPDQTGESLLEIAKRAARSMQHRAEPYRHAKRARPPVLRVGFLSSDFRRHACAFFLEPTIRAMDRQRFHVTGFAQFSGKKPDATTERFKTMLDGFVDVSAMPDPALAATIRDAGIDVLVDIGGHTHGSRSSVCLLKPAPAIVEWLGYPASLGMEEIDARIGDAISDPPANDSHFVERMIRLRGPFLCYAPPADTQGVAPVPSAISGFVTFGVFNNHSKINPDVAAAWARILAGVPGSRLLVKVDLRHRPRAARYVRDLLTGAGIAPHRIDLVDYLPEGAPHFGSFARIDIALDPFPYNGTTTTFETLWMGVPVVTLAGSRHAARVGASILTHAGCTELVATDIDDYVARAVALAGDRARLAGYRQNLRAKLAASPLMDEAAFARDFEAALDDAFAQAMARL